VDVNVTEINLTIQITAESTISGLTSVPERLIDELRGIVAEEVRSTCITGSSASGGGDNPDITPSQDPLEPQQPSNPGQEIVNSCGNLCGAGEECQNGFCLTICSGIAVDISSSEEHCGGCGNACDTLRQTCQNGFCDCRYKEIQRNRLLLQDDTRSPCQICSDNCGKECKQCNPADLSCSSLNAPNGTACTLNGSEGQGICSSGICSNSCNGVATDVQTSNEHCGSCGSGCVDGKTCKGGICTDSCDNSCTAGQICEDGSCVDTEVIIEGGDVGPCEGVACSANTTCDQISRLCMDSCDNSCTAGQICEDGSCVDTEVIIEGGDVDPCEGVACSACTTCNPSTGSCTDNVQNGTDCPDGQCINGRCALFNGVGSCQGKNICGSCELGASPLLCGFHQGKLACNMNATANTCSGCISNSNCDNSRICVTSLNGGRGACIPKDLSNSESESVDHPDSQCKGKACGDECSGKKVCDGILQCVKGPVTCESSLINTALASSLILSAENEGEQGPLDMLMAGDTEVIETTDGTTDIEKTPEDTITAVDDTPGVTPPEDKTPPEDTTTAVDDTPDVTPPEDKTPPEDTTTAVDDTPDVTPPEDKTPPEDTTIAVDDTPDVTPPEDTTTAVDDPTADPDTTSDPNEGKKKEKKKEDDSDTSSVIAITNREPIIINSSTKQRPTEE